MNKLNDCVKEVAIALLCMFMFSVRISSSELESSSLKDLGHSVNQDTEIIVLKERNISSVQISLDVFKVSQDTTLLQHK